MFHTNYVLYLFLQKLNNYEPELFDYIKRIFIYKFKSNEELAEVVQLWCGKYNETHKLYHCHMFTNYNLH